MSGAAFRFDTVFGAGGGKNGVGVRVFRKARRDGLPQRGQLIKTESGNPRKNPANYTQNSRKRFFPMAFPKTL
jgi:hypothetical protein